MTETTIIHLPERLLQQAKVYVQDGWFPDIDSLVAEALRRYLETHQADLMERFVRDDVEWGLRGNE